MLCLCVYVTVHVGMCVIADDPDSSAFKIKEDSEAASKEEHENASAITV